MEEWLIEELDEIGKLNLTAKDRLTLQLYAIFENHRRNKGSYEKIKEEFIL